MEQAKNKTASDQTPPLPRRHGVMRRFFVAFRELVGYHSRMAYLHHFAAVIRASEP